MDPNTACVVCRATAMATFISAGFACVVAAVRYYFDYRKAREETERERIKSARMLDMMTQANKLSADANHNLKLRIDTELGKVEITPPSPAPQRKVNQPSRAHHADWISQQRAEGRGGDAK